MPLPLEVEVTEVTAGGGHDVANGGRRGSIAHVDDLVQVGELGRGLVGPGLVGVGTGAKVGVAGVDEGEAKTLPGCGDQ